MAMAIQKLAEIALGNYPFIPEKDAAWKYVDDIHDHLKGSPALDLHIIRRIVDRYL